MQQSTECMPKENDIDITAVEGTAQEAESEKADGEVTTRRKERSLTFLLLYGMDAWNYEVSLDAIQDNLNRGFDTQISSSSDIMTMAAAVVEQRNELDAKMKPLLAHWRIERLGVCTRLILRLAVWEFLHTDTPPQIIINEAIELAKCFAEKDAYRFVNGVLDELNNQMEKEKSQD